MIIAYFIIGYILGVWMVLHYSRDREVDKGAVFCGFFLVVLAWPVTTPFFLADVIEDRRRLK